MAIDRPDVLDPSTVDPDAMYAFPGTLVDDIFNQIHLKRGDYQQFAVEDIPLNISLIEGGGGGVISVFTDTVVLPDEVRPLTYTVPNDVPLDAILFAEVSATRNDIIAAKESSSTVTLLQSVFANFMPNYIVDKGSTPYGTSIRCGYTGGSFGYGLGGPTDYGSNLNLITRAISFSGGVNEHRFAKDVVYTIRIYYKGA